VTWALANAPGNLEWIGQSNRPVDHDFGRQFGRAIQLSMTGASDRPNE
jgi:hypothetical protein